MSAQWYPLSPYAAPNEIITAFDFVRQTIFQKLFSDSHALCAHAAGLRATNSDAKSVIGLLYRFPAHVSTDEISTKPGLLEMVGTSNTLIISSNSSLFQTSNNKHTSSVELGACMQYIRKPAIKASNGKKSTTTPFDIAPSTIAL